MDSAAHTDPAEEADLFLGPFEDESPAACASPRPVSSGGNAMEILQSVNHAASAREVPARMARHELPAEANEIMGYADDRKTGSHERGGAADCPRSHDHQTARSSGTAARPSAVRGDADGDLADAVRSQQLELEARQNELHLAMHEVESMPASEAQTACIIRLAARMRLLVELRGKSEVGRILDV